MRFLVHRRGLDRHGPRGLPRRTVGHPVGACWAFIWDKINYFIYGSYPIAERWRVNIFFALLASASSGCSGCGAPRATRRDLLLRRLPASSRPIILLVGCRPGPRPRAGADVAVGRRAGHAARRDRRHRVLAAARHPAGARPALEAADRAARLGDLHRVRARRAADHRAVHGQHHAAAVPARRHDRRPAAAAARRRGAVRLGLHGRGGARRPAGHAEGPVRGRHVARPRLLEDDGLHHPAAGAEDRDPRHREHLHRPVQGHVAGLHRRHLRPRQDHRGLAHRPELGGADRSAITGYAFAALFYFIFCFGMSRYSLGDRAPARGRPKR